LFVRPDKGPLRDHTLRRIRSKVLLWARSGCHLPQPSQIPNCCLEKRNWEPGNRRTEINRANIVKIMLATSAFPMTRACEKASMALAPQPFLENVNIGSAFPVTVGTASIGEAVGYRMQARREERRIVSSNPRQTEKASFTALHALRSVSGFIVIRVLARWHGHHCLRAGPMMQRPKGWSDLLEKGHLLGSKGSWWVSGQRKKPTMARSRTLFTKIERSNLAPEERSVMSGRISVHIYMHKRYY